MKKNNNKNKNNNNKKQRNELRFVVGSVSLLAEKITEYTEIRFVFNFLLIDSTETRWRWVSTPCTHGAS